MTAYDEIDTDLLDAQQLNLSEEIKWTRKNGAECAPVTLLTCEILATLLSCLAEIAMHAPGGHGFLIDEARYWSKILSEGADQ